MDFTNPNDFWMHKMQKYDPYKDMDDDDRLKAGCIQAFIVIMMMLVGLGICCLMGSCTTTKYVTVPEVHEIHHNHTDSVIQRDSVVKETQTTVMQLDSAAMAQYGIQLKSAERAWLVRTAELERQIQQLKELRNDSIQKADSIPYPVEVPVEVPAQLTWWQQTRLHIGGVVFWLLAFAVAWYIGGLLRKVKKFLP